MMGGGGLLWLALVLGAVQLRTASAQPPLRVLIDDWVWTFTNPSPPVDYYTDLAPTVNFLLAIKHINERRSDILPVLALPNCTRNISITAYVDDGGNPARAISGFDRYRNSFDALLGIAASSVAIPTAYLGTVQQKPIISHFATSPDLSDKDNYPFFSRTVLSDASTAAQIVNLIHSLGYDKFILLCQQVSCFRTARKEQRTDGFEKSSSSMAEVYELLVSSIPGMSVYNFGFSSDNPDGVIQTMNAVETTRLNVIVIHATILTVHQANLVEAMNTTGFLSADKLFIFPDFDRSPTAVDLQKYPDIIPLYSGALRVAASAENTSQFQRYLNLWTNEFSESNEYTNFINSYLPPQGFRNNTDLHAIDTADWAYSLQINGSAFFTTTADSASLMWANAYDAAIALILASCYGQTTQEQKASLPTGSQLMQNLVQQDFEGLSGRVRFLPTGDRNTIDFDYQIINYHLDGTLQTLLIYDSMNDSALRSLNFNNAKFRNGSNKVPPEITPPPNQFQVLSPGLKALGYAEICIVTLLVFGFTLWTIVNRRDKVVVASQATFLYLILLGALSSGWAILPLTMDGTTDGGVNLDMACMAAPFCFSLGAMLSIMALLAQSLRVLSIQVAPSPVRGGRVRLSRWRALSIVAIGVLIDASLLVAWLLVNPLQWTTVVQVQDKNNFPLLSFGACNPQDPDASAGAFGFVGAIICLHVLAIAGVSIVTLKIGNIPVEYIPKRNLWLLLWMQFELYLIGVPVFAAIISNPYGRFVVLSCIAFFSSLIFMLFTFIPKILLVRQRNEFYAWQKSRSLRRSDIDFEEAMGNKHVREKFRKFCEKNYVIESFYFYLDASEFKNSVLTDEAFSSLKVLIQRAKGIEEIYIKEGSILEINIPSRARNHIEKELVALQLSMSADVRIATSISVNGIPPGSTTPETLSDEEQMVDHEQLGAREAGQGLNGDTRTIRQRLHTLFDMAVKEIVQLLSVGAWRDFVDQGGMYKTNIGEATEHLQGSPVKQQPVPPSPSPQQNTRRLSSSSPRIGTVTGLFRASPNLSRRGNRSPDAPVAEDKKPSGVADDSHSLPNSSSFETVDPPRSQAEQEAAPGSALVQI